VHRRPARGGAVGNPAAPAASDAGPGERQSPAAREHQFEVSGLQEHVVDAVQYLLLQHMPWLVLFTTMAFPLVVGVGGFLTAGGSPLLLAALAAVPGLCVLAVVGAMGRLVLVTSSEGSFDVPSVPPLGTLVREARRFLADAVLVLGTLIAPSIAALALGAPWTTTLPALATGAFFAPLAWGLRQVRGDYGALSPVTLLRGVARCGLPYFGLAAVCWSLFAPAVLVAWAVFGRPVWVQIAIIGPLGVLPLFAASRLIGTWLDTMRLELGGLLHRTRAARPAAAATSAGPTTAAASLAATPAVEPPRYPRRPAALEHFAAPVAKGRAAAPPKSTAASGAPAANGRRPASAKAPAAARRVPAPPPQSVARPPVARPPAAKPPAAKTPAAKPPVPKPRAAKPAEKPDLSSMPGAVVVSGRERARHGAAAPRPR
jgi:hypothetical protein